MANERYVQQVQPSLFDKAWGTGKAVIEKGGQFIDHADDVVDMAPPAAAVWLAVIVGLATYKVVSSIGKNIGPRDGAARLVRGAAYVLAVWMASNYAHDNFLESKGYAIDGKQPQHQPISVSPRSADFDRAAKPYKRTYDYAPHYSGDGEAVSHGRAADASAARRHNSPIARPE